MQLDVLREYILLAKTLNYHVASKELHVSQPTLSNHIRMLEQETGVPLIDRSHGVRLTKAGAVFLRWAAETVASYDAILEKCRSISEGKHLSFSIQASQLNDHAKTVLLDRIRRFRESRPQLNISMPSTRGGFVLDEIIDGHYDCALYIEQATMPELEARHESLTLVPLCQNEAVLWAHVDNPLVKKTDLSLRDLADSTVPIHANDNARLWEMALENDFRDFDAKPTFAPRYAASPEEFIMTEIHASDVLVLPKGCPDSPPCCLVDNRVAVSFNPPVVITAYMAYRKDEGKTALQEFMDYIEDEYWKSLASGEQPCS